MYLFYFELPITFFFMLRISQFNLNIYLIKNIILLKKNLDKNLNLCLKDFSKMINQKHNFYKSIYKPKEGNCLLNNICLKSQCGVSGLTDVLLI